ncbi:MAG: FHA domain-containing protein [Chloroflexi bacterium]|nr:FHA domain-containing protein [Chloroflexota bacterium]
MQESKLCIFCLHENASDATECSQCHAPFQTDMRTPVVPSEIADLLALDNAVKAYQKTVSKTVTLHVVSEKNPLFVPFTGRVILGRSPNEDDSQLIDLKPFRAHLLGVSRQHAALMITDEECLLEDLNSMNGTWVNENRLSPHQPTPVQDGDLIRLGLLLMFLSRRAG